jgi:type IV secretion system protein VirB5
VFVTQKGEVLGTERVGGKPFNPDEQVLQFLTQEWVQWVRSIPLDPEVLRRNWDKAMHMSTQPVAARLFKYAKDIDLTALAKKAQERELAVKVVIESVLMLSERTIRLQWRETMYDGANVERDTTKYTGEFEFILRKPANQQEFDANPLGIWMARFTWSKDLV